MSDMQSTKVKGIIDRIEGNYAIIELEDMSVIDISLELFDFIVKPGICISIIKSKNHKIIREDKQVTDERITKIEKLMNDVFK